jgi:hypothetical protein
MPQSSAAWTGAPPVSEGSFSFINGELFVQTSSQKRHRRATLKELKKHFTSGSHKDYPAHWFEAQLIHYGLQQSKTKSVARMRLLHAVNSEQLLVPSSITELECKLGKEWTKQDKEAKKTEEKGGSGPKTTARIISTTTVGAKRKADITVGVTLETDGMPSNSTNQSRAKRARATNNTTSKKNLFTTDRTALSSVSAKAKTSHPRRAGISQKLARGEPKLTLCSPPVCRPKQTARRSNAAVARGRIRTPAVQKDNFNNFSEHSPLPYSEYYGKDEIHENDGAALAPLGLLKGQYDISSPYVTEEWPDCGSDFELDLTISGSTLWGQFYLGVIEGLIYFEERPRRSSNKNVPFRWRGYETGENSGFAGDGNEGWIRFLGGGRIKGYFDYQRIYFQGQRKSEQSTKSGIDVSTLQSKWDKYEEEKYEW